MNDLIRPSAAVDGNSAIPIPFPAKGSWLELGEAVDLGPFSNGFCSGHFYKTPENTLHVYLQVMTWGDWFIKEYIPLRVPDQSESILYIRWRAEGVLLRQDGHETIDATWRQPQ